MNFTKVKKHFSLIMVQKSIQKNKKKASKPNDVPSQREQKLEQSLSIPKFYDPCSRLHLYGDITFFFQLNEFDKIGLYSLNTHSRSIVNILYNHLWDSWFINYVMDPFELDSWELVYERLMSLGDKSAHDLAQTMKSFFLEAAPTSKEFTENTKISVKKSLDMQTFKKEADSLFKKHKNSFHGYLVYEMHSKQKGLELKKVGFSKKLINLIWGTEKNFVDLTLNSSLFDFVYIEKENYFEYLKTNILNVMVKNIAERVKLLTFEGFSTYLTPIDTSKICFDDEGNILARITLFEFKVDLGFLKMINQAREKNTKLAKPKNKREENLEEMLSVYYIKEDATDSQKFQKAKSDSWEETKTADEKKSGFEDI